MSKAIMSRIHAVEDEPRGVLAGEAS